MQKCPKCGESMFVWDVAKHQCPEQEPETPIENAPEVEPNSFVAENAGEEQSELVEKVLTEEDFDNNPELAAQGLNIGDKIGIGAAEEKPETPEPTKFQEDSLPAEEGATLEEVLTKAEEEEQSETVIVEEPVVEEKPVAKKKVTAKKKA